MNKVVERGVARCPRCVAIADYSFVECDDFLVRYEVRCRRCSELYVEQTCTAPIVFSTALEPYEPPAAPQPSSLAQLTSELHRRWAAGTEALASAWAAAVRLWARLRTPAPEEYTAIGSGH